ncbi:CaiB/BaiF CoA transferase family protein [Deinococcus apachensis]|uniref:CaiB/BaiF CoA transferase family protein n=1 Tax=Deinococcus apachensis TaxID=309886 RepID=UPI0003812C8D|nr:CoA transferase [Deinococcus apachensis]
MTAPGSHTTPLPLEGVRVLDLSSLYAGPLIATTLGDFGAEVVKVEHPRGDDARRWGLSKMTERGDIPLWWKVISRNKRLLSLDLHRETDRETVLDLCRWADVVVENFRPGRLESWGLGYEQLSADNPGLVMARVSGFGQTGPLSAQPGFGTLAEAFSGFAFITGTADGPPTLPPFGLADGVAALAGTYAVMMALYWRDAKGGRGQVVDLSLYEPLFSILGPQAIEYAQTGTVQTRRGNRSQRTSPRNTYRTRDERWVALSGGTQQVVNRMLVVIGRPELCEDARFRDAAARRRNADELDALIADWIATHDLDVVLARFREIEAPLAPVYSIDQIVEDEQYRARQSLVEVPDEDLGTALMPNVLPRLSLTPGRIRFPGRTPIGADTDAIYRDLLGREPPEPAGGEP